MKTELIIIGIVIVLMIVAFFSGSYYIRNKVTKEQELMELINLGYQQGFQQTVIEITQTGNIPVVTNNTIQWFPIRNFCGG